MGRTCCVFFLVCLVPSLATAGTSHDLRQRIRIDGNVEDFLADEWILDDSSAFREPANDSRWGADSEIRAVALTWDDFNLYMAVRAVTASTALMLFVDVACGGLDNLNNAGVFRRNIEFAGINPNLLIKVDRTSGETGSVDCESPLDLIDSDQYESVYVQESVEDGALEVAIPWRLLGRFERLATGTVVPWDAIYLRVLTVVTGGTGSGAGDAAPDPSVTLENDSTRVAILNNYAELTLDVDGDGLLDTGISPRNAASFGVSRSEEGRQVLPLQVILRDKLIEPGIGVGLSFRASLNPAEYDQPVYVSARIYSSTGRLLRTVLQDEPRDLSSQAVPVWDSWDGRDNEGNVVPGGIYVLAVSGGPGRAAPKTTVKASFAVIR